MRFLASLPWYLSLVWHRTHYIVRYFMSRSLFECLSSVKIPRTSSSSVITSSEPRVASALKHPPSAAHGASVSGALAGLSGTGGLNALGGIVDPTLGYPPALVTSLLMHPHGHHQLAAMDAAAAAQSAAAHGAGAGSNAPASHGAGLGGGRREALSPLSEQHHSQHSRHVTGTPTPMMDTLERDSNGISGYQNGAAITHRLNGNTTTLTITTTPAGVATTANRRRGSDTFQPEDVGPIDQVINSYYMPTRLYRCAVHANHVCTCYWCWCSL